MNKIVLLFLSLALIKNLFAQQSRVDSLKQLVENARDDSAKVRNICTLADILWRIDNEQALLYANRGLTLAEKYPNPKGEGHCLNAIGVVYFNRGNYDSALIFFRRRLKKAQEIKDSVGQAASYDNIGVIMLHTGDMDSALQLRIKGIEIYKALKRKTNVGNGYTWIGNIYMTRGNDSAALKNFLNALEIYEEANDENNIGYALVNISNIYRRIRQYEKAEEFGLAAIKKFREAREKSRQGLGAALYRLGLVKTDLDKCDTAITLLLEAKNTFEAKDKYNIALTNDQLGTNYRKKKEYGVGLVYSIEALTAATELNNPELIATVKGNIGLNYKEQRNHAKALDYLRHSYGIFKILGNKVSQKTIIPPLIETFSRLNKQDSVLFYLNQYEELSDSLYDEQRNKAIAEMEKKYESDKKDLTIEALNRANEIKQRLAEKEKQNKNNIVIFGTFILAAAGLSAFFYFRKKQSQHELKTNELENRALRSQLNPHFIFNALNSIRGFMNEYPDRAQSHLIKFSKLMREVLENSEKELICLDDELAMLKKYMELEYLRIDNGFDYEINIDPVIDQESLKVPPLILQPIVENAIWHGIAGRKERGKIGIQIQLNGKMLLCVIENYCAGKSDIVEFKMPEKKSSWGMKIVSDRLKLLSKKGAKGFLKKFPLNDGMKIQLGIPV